MGLSNALGHLYGQMYLERMTKRCAIEVVAIIFALVACKTDKAPSTSAVGSGSVRSASVRSGAVVTSGTRASTPAPGSLPAWKRYFPNAEVIGEDMVMTDKGAKPMYVDPPFIEGATGAAEATAYEPELVAALESGIKLDAINRDRLNKCKAELLARGVKIDARASWVMGFHWKGDGRTVRLARIITVDELWPTFFDEAAKQCWIDAFAGAAFESTLLIDRVIETGFCVYSDELEGDKE